MTYLVMLLFLGFFFFASASSVHAIIFLPALILIPIAKIIAVVIGGMAIPAFGLGAVYHYLFGKSLKRTIGVTLVILFVLAVLIFIILKLQNPLRPIF